MAELARPARKCLYLRTAGLSHVQGAALGGRATLLGRAASDHRAVNVVTYGRERPYFLLIG